jgi:hypothetical protein
VGEFEDGHGGAAGDFGLFGVGEGDEGGDGFGGVVEGVGLEMEGVEVLFELEGVAGGVVGGEVVGGGLGEGDGVGEVLGEVEGGEELAYFGGAVGENLGGGGLVRGIGGHGFPPCLGRFLSRQHCTVKVRLCKCYFLFF